MELLQKAINNGHIPELLLTVVGPDAAHVDKRVMSSVENWWLCGGGYRMNICFLRCRWNDCEN